MRSNRKLTPPLKIKIAALFEQGSSTQELSGQFKLSRPTIVSAIRSKGIVLTGPKRVSKEIIREIVNAFNQGSGISQIVKQFNLSESGIRQILIRTNVYTPTRKGFSRRKNLSAEEKTQMATLYSEGQTIQQISETFGIDVEAARRAIRSTGLQTTSLIKINEADAEQVSFLYQQGCKTEEIAEKFNVHSTTILNILKRVGIKARWSKFDASTHRDEIISKYATGMSAIAIGRELGRSRGVVEKVLLDSGVTLRSIKDYWKIPEFYEKNKLKPESRRGPDSHAWKGGRTPMVRLIRANRESLEWRNAVLSRDRHTCQHCGKKRGLHADHIYPFSKILDDYDITSVEEALECNALWDISNGRTLCIECHRKTPTWGSKKKQKKRGDNPVAPQ